MKKTKPAATAAKKGSTMKSTKPVAKVAKAAKKGFPAKKATGTARPKRKPLATYKAPADFKPHFLLVQVATEADGLLATEIKATRYQGRFDREASDKKKFDLASYDSKTLIGIQARFAAVTFKANADKKWDADPKARAGVKGGHRLPASTVFQILLRVGKKSADQSLTAGVKQIWQGVADPKTGRNKLKELDKKDPAYRAFRKASRILPAAFKAVQIPPKRTRGKVEEE